MSRINLVAAEKLIDVHLLAEHREIKRICHLYSKRLECGKFDDIPESYTLGTGHMKFFLDKGEFTYRRYQSLRKECLNRGFKIADYWKNWNIINDRHWNSYIPNSEEININIHRIALRLCESKKPLKYYRKTISIREALRLLCQ